MIKWPSIGSIFNIRKYLNKYDIPRKVKYRGKIKIDGTNGSVVIKSNGQVIVQSRSRAISTEDDNMGFARWVHDNYNYFSELKGGKDFIIFGEWAGKGIQGRTAISAIPNKIFAVFAIQVDGNIIISPHLIKPILHPNQPNDVCVLPWQTDIIELDYSDTDTLQAQVQQLNELVYKIEECDPWVKENFDISGIGEGLVMYPLEDGDIIDREKYSNLVFKAKGEKHQVVKTKKPVQIDPEVAKSIDDFVELVITTNRLEQIAQSVGEFDFKNIKDFLKDLGQDAKKESTAELEAASLEWKDVSKAVTTKARNWYIAKCKGEI